MSSVPGERLLDRDGLAAKGIDYAQHYLRRLMREGRFPQAVRLSPRKIRWREADIDAWVEQKARGEI